MPESLVSGAPRRWLRGTGLALRRNIPRGARGVGTEASEVTYEELPQRPRLAPQWGDLSGEG